jgi:hypothetical protein
LAVIIQLGVNTYCDTAIFVDILSRAVLIAVLSRAVPQCPHPPDCGGGGGQASIIPVTAMAAWV